MLKIISSHRKNRLHLNLAHENKLLVWINSLWSLPISSISPFLSGGWVWSRKKKTNKQKKTQQNIKSLDICIKKEYVKLLLKYCYSSAFFHVLTCHDFKNIVFQKSCTAIFSLFYISQHSVYEVQCCTWNFWTKYISFAICGYQGKWKVCLSSLGLSKNHLQFLL